MYASYEDIYESICRVCLSQSENVVPLIDNSSEKGLSCFGISVMAFTDVIVEKSDNLPLQMCQNCVFLLKQAIFFKLKCETSDRKLKNLVKENLKNSPEQSITEIVCQYIMFNSYFPPIYGRESIGAVNKKIENELQCDNSVKNNGSFKVVKDDASNLNFDYDQHSEVEENTECQDNKVNNELCEYPNVVDENEVDAILDTIHDMLNAATVVVKKRKQRRKKDKKIEIDDSTDIEDNNMSDEKNTTSSTIVAKENINLTESKVTIKKSRQKTKKDQKLFCNICNKMFAYRSSHRLHMRRHENGENLEGRPRRCKRKKQQQYVCKICDRLLASCASYIVHMRRHNNFPYICDQCGKGFAVPNEMRMHQVTKHGIGPCLQCDYCPFKTTIKSYLVEHVRLHTGERPFTCEHCGLTFRRRAIWKKHLVRHTDKKFQCTNCPLKFFSNFQLSEHCNSMHDRKYMYICNICSATYIQTKMVRRHMIVEHGVPREEQGKIVKVTVDGDGVPER